ncbi:MAG: ABC transporter substrate-binding protein, partial [Alphaproteobacteria bacterium]
MRRFSISAQLLGTAAFLAVLGAGTVPVLAKEITLRIAVPDWPPTRIMKQLADEFYKAPSGNDVVLEPDFIPWPNFQDRLSASLTSGEQRYNMAVSDSQWLGQFVEGGYYKQ